MKLFIDHDNGALDALTKSLMEEFEIVDDMKFATHILSLKHPSIINTYDIEEFQKLIYIPPIDAIPLGDEFKVIKDKVDYFVPITSTGYTALVREGITNVAKPIPFSYDPELYYKFSRQDYDNLRRDYELTDEIVIGYSGVQDTRSDLMTLLFAFKNLVALNHNKYVLMLHTQVHAPNADFDLIKLINLMGIGDKVMLIDGPSSADLYNLMNVFVSTARADVFSLALMRALACGTPAAVPAYGGFLDLVDEKNGSPISIDSYEEMINGTVWANYTTESIVESIKTALNKPESNMSRFTHDEVAKQWIQLLKEIEQ